LDPIRPLSEPIAEVRRQAPVHVDEYGESWMMIDGVETKVTSRKIAEAQLVKQDKVRVEIRTELDRLGLRDNMEEIQCVIDGVPQVDGDGEPVMISLVQPARAQYMQIEEWPFDDPRGYDKAELRNREVAEMQARMDAAKAAKLPKPSLFARIVKFFRKEQ
jgi:hypothetical protein